VKDGKSVDNLKGVAVLYGVFGTRLASESPHLDSGVAPGLCPYWYLRPTILRMVGGKRRIRNPFLRRCSEEKWRQHPKQGVSRRNTSTISTNGRLI